MLSCSPIGSAAGLPPCSEEPFPSWAQKLRLTKKVFRQQQIFPRRFLNSNKEVVVSANRNQQSELFFQRFLGMRNSFKSLKLSPSSSMGVKLPAKVDESTSNMLEGCSSSKDSGLGEEEESPPQATTTTGILSTRSPSSSEVSSKKHVMIREPSLSNLPSAQRRVRQSLRVVRTRVYAAPSQLQRPNSDTVQSQWEDLYAKASAELKASLPDLDPLPLQIIFRRDPLGQPLEVEDISAVLRAIYNVLYHDWTKQRCVYLPLSLHCIHTFLVSAVRSLDLQEPDLKERSAERFSKLLRDCELLGYSQVTPILQKSQGVFIEFWCSLLNVPHLKDSFSPQERNNVLRLSLKEDASYNKALKHRSSIF